MRVNGRGQVTIPAEIRRGLGIECGSEVSFVERPGGVVQILPKHDARAQAFHDWLGQFGGSADINGTTIDEFMDWMKGPHEVIRPC
jgi:AbrB family looped-hinge helix DNA binding protein